MELMLSSLFNDYQLNEFVYWLLRSILDFNLDAGNVFAQFSLKE